MLTCREVAERAEHWLDQDLGTWQTLQMRLHLAMCKGCDRFVSQMRQTRDLTQAAANAERSDLHDGDKNRINDIFSKLHDEKQSKG